MVGDSLSAQADFGRLRDEIHNRGLDRKPTGRVLAELCFHVVLSLGGAAVFIWADNWLLRVLAILVSTAGSMGVGSNSHTSSHGATSRKSWVNLALTYFGSPFFFGVSATYWWHKHVSGHHRTPNVIGADPDVDFMPLFALTEQEVQGSSGWRRWYYRRVQWLVFPLALALNQFNMQKDGWRHLIACLADPARRSSGHWIDLISLILHFTLFVALPLMYFPAIDVAAFTCLRWALFGYSMFAVLAPAHWPAEAAFKTDNAAQRDSYAGRQLERTLNFRAGSIGSFFCSGLDYQIEHHLFPSISHVHYPALSGLVRDYCAAHGLPYRSLSWAEALHGSLSILRRPKAVHGDSHNPEPVMPVEPGHANSRLQDSILPASILVET